MTTANPVTTIRSGERTYPVDMNGWCAALGCWVYRDPADPTRLVTIPERTTP